VNPHPHDTQADADHARAQEDALVRAAIDGNHDAFGALFRDHYPRIHRTLLGMLGDPTDAAEIAQQAWIKAWQNLPRFNFQSRFLTWVHRIAVNCALDELRRRRRRNSRFLRLFTATDHDRPDTAPRPPDALAASELGTSIDRAIASLTDSQRTVLVLREYDGYSYEEIAAITGTRIGTVMSRLHAARTKLQSILSHLRP